MKLTPASRLVVAALALTAVALVLRGYGLGAQPLTEDDLLVAESTARYVGSGQLGPTEWNHPDLRSLLVWCSLVVGGTSVMALKLPSLLLGAVTIPLLILLVVQLGGSRRAALVAGVLLTVDGLHVAFSRQAVQEVYMAAFALSGALAALAWRRGRSPLWLLASGVFFGLGVASKWDVAGPLAVTVVVLVGGELERGADRRAVARATAIAAAVGLTAVAVYLATFLPWFGRGYELAEWVRLQVVMLTSSAGHGGAHNPYLAELDHQPWLWFVKPVSYASFTPLGGRPFVIAGFANPLVWLAVWPAVVALARRRGEGRRDRFFLLALFGASYAPFLLSGRPVWAHSALSVLPWGLAALSMALDGWLPQRRGLLLYLGAALLVALPIYLMATGAGLDIPLLRPVVMSLQPSAEG